MSKVFKIILIVLLIGLLLGGGYYAYTKFFSQDAVPKEEILTEIKKYNYKLSNSDPEIFKTLFEQLNDELKKETINEEAYATLIAKLYAIDFYNLSGKSSKNDVGGAEFIYTPAKENFILEASDTIYKYIEHNLYGDRVQSLPTVTDVVVDEITQSSYKYDKKTDDNAFNVKLTITYLEDLGYPTTLNLKLIHEEVVLKEATENTPAETLTKLAIVSAK